MYIITIAEEILDTEKNKWLSIEETIEILNKLENENKKLKQELEWCRITIDGLKYG